MFQLIQPRMHPMISPNKYTCVSQTSQKFDSEIIVPASKVFFYIIPWHRNRMQGSANKSTLHLFPPSLFHLGASVKLLSCLCNLTYHHTISKSMYYQNTERPPAESTGLNWSKKSFWPHWQLEVDLEGDMPRKSWTAEVLQSYHGSNRGRRKRFKSIINAWRL